MCLHAVHPSLTMPMLRIQKCCLTGPQPKYSAKTKENRLKTLGPLPVCPTGPEIFSYDTK